MVWVLAVVWAFIGVGCVVDWLQSMRLDDLDKRLRALERDRKL